VLPGAGWTCNSLFDRVNHDRLMARLKSRCPDADVLRLINRFLKAGVQVDGRVAPRRLGVPQGGPLSPVLANVVLDELDWELDRRGHRFARYADDCNILVKSQRAGERVMASVTRFVSDSLRLTVNPLKSAVDRPWNRKFLGFTVSRNGQEAQGGRQGPRQAEGPRAGTDPSYPRHRICVIVAELRDPAWLESVFRHRRSTEPSARHRQVDTTQVTLLSLETMGSAGYRELRKRGVSVREAWNTSKSAHGPWRVSQTPALSIALPLRFFEQMGLPSLAPR
jgi:RNA-directed DNA polymerase